MKVVGLFREISSGANQTIPTINDVVGGLPLENVPAVVTYLQSGVPIFDVMEASVDPFDKSVQIPGGPSLISDGIWIWRNDLAYFVEKYRVGLPADFIVHALHCGVASVDRLSTTGEWEKILEEYELAENGGASE